MESEITTTSTESITVPESASKKTRKQRVVKVKAPRKAKAPRRGKGKTGKRYSPEFKANVLKWLSDNNERGSVGKAMEKFGMSYISLRGWLRNAGISKPGRKGKKGKVGRPKGKRGRPVGSGRRGRPAGVKVVSHPLFTKRARKRILKGLKRMGHGIEMLAEAFSHIT